MRPNSRWAAPRLIWLVGAVLAALALATSACSGSEGTSSLEAATAGPSAANGSGSPDTPGDAAPDPDQGSQDGDAEPATPTPYLGPTAPLTGLPVEDPSIMDRPALAIKIGASSLARPHTGLSQADILIEVRVESITRLMAVFHSQGADPVGPVRSARSSDPDILSNFGQPLFGYSGANDYVLQEVRQGENDGKLYGLAWGELYWRVPDRVAPFNFFTATSNFWDNAPSHLDAPEPLFQYRDPGEAVVDGAEPVPGLEIRYQGGTIVHFVWDAEAGGWARWQDNDPHMEMARLPDGTPNRNVDPAQLTPANVVVLQTRYTGSAACSYCPEAISVDPDGGVALIFTDGHLIRGQWTRSSASQQWQVTDGDGNPVRLTPGQTFIALPGGDVFVMVEDFAEELLKSR